MAQEFRFARGISPASNGNFFSKGEDYFALAASKAGEKEKAADLFKKVANWNQNGLHFALVRTKAKMTLENKKAEKK